MKRTVDRRAAMQAAALAGVAYAAEMEVDLRLVGHNADDLRLFGGLVTSDRAAARAIGLGVHLGNAFALGLVYAAVAHDRLPGPAWLRGVVFANVENLVLYPLATFDRFHPAIRRGELGRYWHPAAFAQSIPRHVAYGAVLGALYERWRR